MNDGTSHPTTGQEPDDLFGIFAGTHGLSAIKSKPHWPNCPKPLQSEHSATLLKAPDLEAAVDRNMVRSAMQKAKEKGLMHHNKQSDLWEQATKEFTDTNCVARHNRLPQHIGFLGNAASNQGNMANKLFARHLHNDLGRLDDHQCSTGPRDRRERSCNKLYDYSSYDNFGPLPINCNRWRAAMRPKPPMVPGQPLGSIHSPSRTPISILSTTTLL